MNKRILELYKLAHVPHKEIDPSNNMPYDSTRFSAEKFAELIVQKCQSLIEEEASKWRGEEDIANFRLAVHVIKDYFEVDKQSG